ncbi:molecular chaperone [Pseudodonghicola sp.]|uniref:fimbrial biogenesis chaperone n=1 Tax=Pseudodonghicola sp. TaxID=1969463 RepID=UPI003A96AB85
MRMLLLWYSLVLACLLGAAVAPARAEGLRVAPVLLEVQAPGAQTSLTLRNIGKQPITVQARVFLWDQTGGEDRLVPTRDVVVSPPITQVRPGGEQSIRIVRTTKSKVRGQEAYRVLVDEVPDMSRQRSGTVDFATRLSIPVFFTAPGSTKAQVAWSVRRSGAGAYLEARNSGQQNLRLVDLRLSRGGSRVYGKTGLFGYVLGGATMRWPLGAVSGIGSGLTLSAMTAAGDYHASVSAR